MKGKVLASSKSKKIILQRSYYLLQIVMNVVITTKK